MNLKYRNTDLEPLIVSIMSQFSSMADSKEIHFELVSTKSVALYVDQEKMEKIISNLLSNAFKFTPAGGHIIITIAQNDSYAEIAISDTGLGIEPEHLSKIFDRFYQVDDSRTGTGVGLGLSIAQWIVQGHNGRIEVQSTAGIGSIFRVFFPAA